MMRSLILLFLALFAFAPAAGQPHDYAEGQVWSYRTAEGDDGSLIKIQQIESIGPDQEMEVFHISMIGLAVDWQPEPLVVEHLPVSRETLDASVIAVVQSEATFPDHREGWSMWKEANGGVFTISLAEIADFIRDQFGPPASGHRQTSH